MPWRHICSPHTEFTINNTLGPPSLESIFLEKSMASNCSRVLVQVRTRKLNFSSPATGDPRKPPPANTIQYYDILRPTTTNYEILRQSTTLPAHGPNARDIATHSLSGIKFHVCCRYFCSPHAQCTINSVTIAPTN